MSREELPISNVRAIAKARITDLNVRSDTVEEAKLWAEDMLDELFSIAAEIRSERIAEAERKGERCPKSVQVEDFTDARDRRFMAYGRAHK